MKKYTTMILCVMLSFLAYPEMTVAQQKGQVQPVESFHSDKIRVEGVNFNKKMDLNNQGEILELEFQISNMTDTDIELYIFTVATFENKPKTPSSFEKPIPEKDRFSTYEFYPKYENHPNKIDNFLVPVKDDKGIVLKDKNGKEIYKLEKNPQDPLKGTDRANKPYIVKSDKNLLIRAPHLSKYRKRYAFFNEASIIIFGKDIDKSGTGNAATIPELLYKQNYTITGFKRH